MKDVFKQNGYFFWPFLFLLSIASVYLIKVPKHVLHLSFNALHHPIADIFFTYFTYLGDGLTAILIIILFLFIHVRTSVLLALSNIITSLIIQVSKHFIFPNEARPKKYFEGLDELYLVPGVENHIMNSFPSGHTGCAFATFLGLALMAKYNWQKLLCLIIASLVGYSRIYLSQHFLGDVYIGAIIGVAVTLAVYIVISTKESSLLDVTIWKKNRKV